MTFIKRLLLSRSVGRDVIGRRAWAKVALLAAALVVLGGLIAVAKTSPWGLAAYVFPLGLCGFTVWCMAPALLDLDALILQLIRLELGGHGPVIDFDRSLGRAFLTAEVRVENLTGCAIKLRRWKVEQIGVGSEPLSPITIETPECACDETVPPYGCGQIKIEKHEIFGRPEGIAEAACLPMSLTISVHFDIEGESIGSPASRTLQSYAMVRGYAT